LLDLLGDFGGLMEVLFIFGGYIIGSYTKYNFNLKAMTRLYLAKTKDENLFELTSTKSSKKRSKLYDEIHESLTKEEKINA